MEHSLTEMLKTVCTAGFAREGFNGETNEQLKALANVGLLVVAYAPQMLAQHRREYRPTEKGWTLFKQLITRE